MALSLSQILRRKNPALLGVDLSASSVKVVELARGQGMPLRLERYAIEPIERGAIVDGAIQRAESVADALARALKRMNTRTREVALSMPSSAVITKRITLPAGLSDEEYELQVEGEASQYIPFAIDEVNLDFQVLGPAPSGEEDEVEVLLAASRKEQVEDRVAVAEMAGLRPMIVDADPFASRIAVDHAVDFLPNHGQDQIVAVFDIGQNVTSLAVVLNGETVFERDQAFGGLQLTQDIQRLYGLSLEEAELKKRTGDLPDNYRTDLLQPFIEQGALDVTRALQFFFTSTPYTRADQIFLAGGCSVLQGFAEIVAERTQVPTEVFYPFQGMEVAESVRERQLQLDAPALLVATGLAMRRFDA